MVLLIDLQSTCIKFGWHNLEKKRLYYYASVWKTRESDINFPPWNGSGQLCDDLEHVVKTKKGFKDRTFG